jgi:hypothetical protein
MVSHAAHVPLECVFSHLTWTTFLFQQIGWKPAESQPKPLKRGSGQMNLKDVLGNDSEGKDPEPKS